jgi:hypothetical protein
MTPSLPTFFMASAMMVPMVVVGVGGDGADLSDHVAGDGLGELSEGSAGHGAVFGALADDRFDSLVDAALEGHGVRAGGNGLDAFAIDGLGENGGGGGAVAGYVGGLRRHFAHHLGAHVLERILELDFLGYGDAVFGDGGRTEFLFDDDVAALGAEGHFDSLRENIHAAQNRLAGIFSVQNLLCHFADLLMLRSRSSV